MVLGRRWRVALLRQVRLCCGRRQVVLRLMCVVGIAKWECRVGRVVVAERICRCAKRIIDLRIVKITEVAATATSALQRLLLMSRNHLALSSLAVIVQRLLVIEDGRDMRPGASARSRQCRVARRRTNVDRLFRRRWCVRSRCWLERRLLHRSRQSFVRLARQCGGRRWQIAFIRSPLIALAACTIHHSSVDTASRRRDKIQFCLMNLHFSLLREEINWLTNSSTKGASSSVAIHCQPFFSRIFFFVFIALEDFHLFLKRHLKEGISRLYYCMLTWDSVATPDRIKTFTRAHIYGRRSWRLHVSFACSITQSMDESESCQALEAMMMTGENPERKACERTKRSKSLITLNY